MTSQRDVDSAGDPSTPDVVDGEFESIPPPAPSAPDPLERRRSIAWSISIIAGFACVGGVLGFFSAKRHESRASLTAATGSLGAAVVRETSTQFAERAADSAPVAASAPPLNASAPAAVSGDQEPKDHGPMLGPNEDELLGRLRTDAITAAKKGSGGRTLAFKISLASGISGYFKPEQSVSSAHWYAELAAYYLDRALGLGRVPAVVGRRVEWSALRAAATGDERVSELAIAPDGTVRGALVLWLNERLSPAVPPPGWENWIRCEAFSRSSVTPYQRAAAYSAALADVRARRERAEPIEAFYQSVPEPERPDLPAELSDMIVFDFLTLNYDRFGGNNANILRLGERGPLIFLDNGDGFSAGPPRRGVLDARLAPLSRFRKRTIEALRAFDMQAFRERLARDPLAPILDEQALTGLAARRDVVLEHVAAQQARYGDAVFAW